MSAHEQTTISNVYILVTNKVWHSARYDAALLYRVYAEGRGELRVIIVGRPLGALPPIKNVSYTSIPRWRFFLLPPKLDTVRRLVVLDALSEYGRMTSALPKAFDVIVILERSVAGHMHRANIFGRRYIRRALRCARHILAPTRSIRNEAEALVEEAEMSVMAPPLFVSWVREDTRSLRAQYPQYTLIVAVVSDFVTSRGLMQLLSIVPDLLAQHPKLGFVVIGNGPLRREVKQFAAKIHHADAIVFLDEHADLIELMQQADIVCLYQTHIVPIQAQVRAIAASTPMIVASEGLARDVLPDTMVHITPRGDPTKLAHTITEMVSDPKRRETERTQLRTLANKAAITPENYQRRVFAHISQEPHHRGHIFDPLSTRE